MREYRTEDGSDSFSVISRARIRKQHVQSHMQSMQRMFLILDEGHQLALMMILRHASNELDSFVLVQGQHCQAESPPFDACRRGLREKGWQQYLALSLPYTAASG